MKLEEIHKYIKEYIFLLDEANVIIEANDHAKGFIKGVVGQKIDEALNDKQILKEISIASKSGFYQDQRMINTKGGYLSGFISIYVTDKGVIVTLRNVTKFKEKEIRLIESEHQKNAMIEAIPDIMFLFNSSGVYLDFRVKDDEKLFFKPSEFINKSIYELYPAEFANQIQTCINNCLYNNLVETLEYEMEHGGNLVCYEARFVKSGDDKVLVLSREVTKEKENIRALNKSLEEKENLLREIHHRVKNNLQVIYSLVRNQIRYAKNKEVEGVLEVTCNRVNTMALVHQKLYTNSNLTNVNLSCYIRDLLQNLENIINVENEVAVHLEVDDFEVHIDIALSIGIIINEIVTNSYKYAFKNQDSCRIKLNCMMKGNVMILEISDNGMGIAKDVQKDQSFGLKLVDMMVEKLKAFKRVFNDEGLVFKFEIPVIK